MSSGNFAPTAWLPGVLLVFAATAAAYVVNAAVPAVSALVAGLAVAMVVANAVRLPASADPGVAFFGRTVLRIAVAGLGLRISVELVEQVGWQGIAVVALSLGGTLLFTVWLGRRLGVSPGLSLLIATGTSICGASAVMAAHPVSGARDEEAAFALGTVTLFGTAAMLTMPVIGVAMLGMEARDYGVWAGASVHEVGQVVAATAGVSAVALETAAAVKLVRVALLAPTLAALSVITHRHGAHALTSVPWFVAAFVVLAAVRSSGIVPPDVLDVALDADSVLLTMALAGLGFTVRLRDLRDVGARPLILGAASSLFIAAASFGLMLATGR